MKDADRIAARRQELLTQLVDLERDLDRIAEASAGANLDDEHDPEGSTVGFERAQLASLADSARSELAALDLAARRIADGKYGICVDCGRPIGAERLAARPASDRCVACAR